MNKTLSRAIDILKYASVKTDGFTVPDIMKEFDLPKSTAYNITNTLINRGMLRFNNENDRTIYLGLKSYEIGSKYSQANSLDNIFLTETKKLGDKLDATVFIGKLDQDQVLYIHKYAPPTAILNPCQILSRHGVYYTALGKVLIAFTKDYDLNKLKLEQYTKNTITDLKVLKDDLEKVRERGYAIDNEESRESMICVAAPIYFENGEIAFSLSTSFLYSTKVDFDKISVDIINAADQISKKLKLYSINHM